MEFMLGVDAPVSFELLRQIVLGIVVDTIVALPMWVLVRALRWRARCPRIRAGAGAARAYTTGGLSPLSQRHERDRAGRRPRARGYPSRRSWRCAWRSSAASRW